MRLGIALGLLAYFVFPLGMELLVDIRPALQAIGKPLVSLAVAMFFVGMLLEWQGFFVADCGVSIFF